MISDLIIYSDLWQAINMNKILYDGYVIYKSRVKEN